MKNDNYLTLFFIFGLFFNSVFANDNEQLFRERVHKVLENRKSTIIKKISAKIHTKEEDVEKNIQFILNSDEIKAIGHVNGILGVCEISGNITIIETAIVGNCIDDNGKVSIIWP